MAKPPNPSVEQRMREVARRLQTDEQRMREVARRLRELQADEVMTQQAPFPTVLAELVSRLTYRPGWTFELINNKDRGQGSVGLTLDVVTRGYNSYHPESGQNYRVHHYMLVPPAAYDRRSWQHWLFEQCLLIERHEAMEFFVIDGEHVYAPNHAPGNDPYIVAELSTAEDRDTSFRGTRNH